MELFLVCVIAMFSFSSMESNSDHEKRIEKLERYSYKVNLKHYEKRTDYTQGIVVVKVKR